MGILLSEAVDAATVAEAEASGQTLGIVGSIVIYALFAVVMYLIVFKPQKKEQKRVASMLADLAEGDCVLTTSGFYGVVINIDDEDNTVIVEFGNNKNCRIPMEKSAISRVEKAGE